MRRLLSNSGPILAVLAGCFTASPAAAQAQAVSEPSDLMLFGLGVAGLVIGRMAAGRKKD